ncbi:MAG: YqgE/AlgH family protein, partial [Leptospira sp.]|nr:YqgE/AlgH family protein [Leptospira sp.]
SSFLLKDVVVGLSGFPNANFLMYWGGPVDQSFISILHDNDELSSPGLEIIPGVYLSRSFELLLKLIESNSKFHIFHGYSGWGSLQLESEFERKSWVSHDANPDIIFHPEPEIVWKEALRDKGGIYKYFAEHIKDPMLN